LPATFLSEIGAPITILGRPAESSMIRLFVRKGSCEGVGRENPASMAEHITRNVVETRPTSTRFVRSTRANLLSIGSFWFATFNSLHAPIMRPVPCCRRTSATAQVN
jgi:hypothetical protein